MLGLGTGINKLSSAEAASIASRSGGYLLDTYSGAAAAYSLRQLSSSYSGNAVKVRRSSDNTETDIGFVGGELDTASLSSFAGAGDAFVVSWFDQSGNSKNATQTTTASQPKIVSSGAVIVENGKPAMDFDGTNHSLSGPTFSPEISQPLTSTVVANPDVIGLMRFWDNMNVGGRLNLSISQYQKYEMQNLASTDNAQAIQSLLFCLYNTTSSSLHVNGAQKMSGDAGTNSMGSLRIGANKTGIQNFNGKYQEAIFWDANLSTNRTNIEDNINTFYSIT